MGRQSIFEKALLDVTLEEYAEIPEEQTLSISFSPEFDQRIAQITRRISANGNFRTKTVSRRFLLVAVIVIFALLATAAMIPSIREGLIKFFTKDTGVAYTFHFQAEDVATAPKVIESYHSPSYLPEGFVVESDNKGVNLFSLIYKNTCGDTIIYIQTILWEEGKPITGDSIPTTLVVDSEGAEKRFIVVSGYEVMAIEAVDKENSTYLWTDHQYLYIITSVPSADINEVVKMINSFTT